MQAIKEMLKSVRRPMFVYMLLFTQLVSITKKIFNPRKLLFSWTPFYILHHGVFVLFFFYFNARQKKTNYIKMTTTKKTMMMKTNKKPQILCVGT